MCPLRTGGAAGRERGLGARDPYGRRRFRHSLLLKLLLVLIATGCLVDLSVGGFFRMMFGRESHATFERNVMHYGHALAAEIGSPPDTARARALARDYGLRIHIQGPHGSWDADTGHGRAGDWTICKWGSKGGYFDSTSSEGAGWNHGCMLVRVTRGEDRFIFGLDLHRDFEGRWRLLALLIAFLSLVLLGAFMAMRRLLHPLKFLTAAVERLGRGELGHQVPAGPGRDELNELARAFNDMSTRLKEHVRSREQLLLDVSHELRSPLTRLKVALEMAPEGMSKESMREDMAEMEAMIGEILEAARLDSANGRLNLEATDMRALVAEAVRSCNGRTPGIAFSGASAPADARAGSSLAGTLRVDRERVKKVIGNVLDNALKYSGGQARPVEVDVREGNEEVTVRVRDHGVGIPEGELARLFEPFYRVDRSRSRDTGGYGLGLSLCKRIMEAHGGRIDIASRPGDGVEVLLIFPVPAP